MLVLASASPARHKLLTKAGIKHKVIVSGVNEEEVKTKTAKRLVQELAKQKTASVLNRLTHTNKNNFAKEEFNAILGCDSLFEFDGEVFGKPKNTKQAIERWERMSNKSGVIHTGHSLLSISKLSINRGNDFVTKQISEVVSTNINFAKLSRREIKEYVLTKEPLNCAGGFALEGRGGMFISSIEGCYTNVIGLSLPWLRSNLKELL